MFYHQGLRRQGYHKSMALAMFTSSKPDKNPLARDSEGWTEN
jgi:hypothetical protein